MPIITNTIPRSPRCSNLSELSSWDDVLEALSEAKLSRDVTEQASDQSSQCSEVSGEVSGDGYESDDSMDKDTHRPSCPVTPFYPVVPSDSKIPSCPGGDHSDDEDSELSKITPSTCPGQNGKTSSQLRHLMKTPSGNQSADPQKRNRETPWGGKSLGTAQTTVNLSELGLLSGKRQKTELTYFGIKHHQSPS